MACGDYLVNVGNLYVAFLRGSDCSAFKLKVLNAPKEELSRRFVILDKYIVEHIMPKIILTISDITTTGGVERVVVNLANALVGYGYEVAVISFYNGALPRDKLPYTLRDEVELHSLYTLPEYKLKERFMGNFLKKIYFKNFQRLAISYKVCKMYRDYDVMITNDWTFAPFFRSKHTLYIKVLHLSMKHFNARNRSFDWVITLTDSQKQQASKFFKNVACIPNFIPSLPSKSTDTSQKVVLAVGRLCHDKGFLRLLEIWNLLKNDKAFAQEFQQWQLRIVGNGQMQAEIQSKIIELGLQDCVFLRSFTKNIEQEYLSASVFVMSSYIEGFPMVLLESSSYGLPIVAFDISTGPSDIIEYAKSGFLIADGNLQDFASKLKILMSDEQKRADFGAYAKQIIGQKFSKEAILSRWLGLFACNKIPSPKNPLSPLKQT